MAIPSRLSPKQLEVARAKLHPINILWGPTGTGKSLAANIAALGAIAALGSGQAALLTGNTTDSLYKNVIRELLELATDSNLGWVFTRSPARISTSTGAEVFCVGINNEGSEDRIQGGSVAFWYADEPTTYPEEAFNMCLSRCRGQVNGRLEQTPVLMTLNPDDELHYIKTRFIDAPDQVQAKVWYFGFEANPIITKEYIDNLSSLYVGDFKARMIDGKWTSSGDKRIIPEFNDAIAKECVKEWERPQWFVPCAALDIGFSDFTAMVAGYYDFKADKFIIDGEWSGRQKLTPEIAAEMLALESRLYPGREVQRWSDTSSQVIADISRLHNLVIAPTRKDDKEAQLNMLRLLIQQGKVIIHPSCVNLIRHLRIGVWNKRKTEFERTTFDGHYDFIDAMVYFIRNCVRDNPYPRMPEGVSIATHMIREDRIMSEASDLQRSLGL